MKDEQKYAHLNAKFHKELMEIEARIEELEGRKNVLRTILFGDPTEALAAVTPAPEETPEQRRERYLLDFLTDNADTTIDDIQKFFDDGTTRGDLVNLLGRLQHEGVVTSTGQGRGRPRLWRLEKEN